MLSKLIKHEFRATARTMLPIYAVVAALTLLANLSLTVMGRTNVSGFQNRLLNFLLGLVVFAFGVSLLAVAVVTGVMMLQRFYRNLLKNEGYLMHTLPVTVHEQIWSKLLVSLVWFAATVLVILLALFLTGFLQSDADLGEMFSKLPDAFKEFRELLREAGVRPGQLILLGLELMVGGLLAAAVLCLHFYSAMALGHMFSKNKVVLSVVFFLGINFLLRVVSTAAALMVLRIDYLDTELWGAAENFSFLSLLLLRGLFIEAAEGIVLYLLTLLGLKRGLNLE